MKNFVIILMLLFLSCNRFTDYKSPLLGKKFKTKNTFVYIRDKNKKCKNTDVLKAPVEITNFKYEFNMTNNGSECYFEKSPTSLSLVPIGTEFEVIDSFMTKGILGMNRVEFVVLKDNNGNKSETLEIVIDGEIKSNVNSHSNDEYKFLADLSYLKKNKELNMLICEDDLYKVDFPQYEDEALNKEWVVRNTHYIELAIENYIEVFSLSEGLQILDLLWIKKNEMVPCVTLSFKTEHAFLTSMFYMERWGIPITQREFAIYDKYEIFDNSKMYYNKKIYSLDYSNLITKYEKVGVSFLSARDLLKYDRKYKSF